jgi:hypothetical protein
MELQNMLNIKKLSETLRLKKFWNSIFKLPLSQSSVWKIFPTKIATGKIFEGLEGAPER